MPKELIYNTKAVWTEKKKAIVNFEDPEKNGIEISVAPEFLGHRHYITPEDLFVSSVNTCMMSYFLNVAEKMRLKFSSYESKAKGVLTETGIDFVFTKIVIDLKVRVPDEKNSKRANRAIDMAKEGCFVANSLKTDVEVNFDVLIG